MKNWSTVTPKSVDILFILLLIRNFPVSIPDNACYLIYNFMKNILSHQLWEDSKNEYITDFLYYPKMVVDNIPWCPFRVVPKDVGFVYLKKRHISELKKIVRSIPFLEISYEHTKSHSILISSKTIFHNHWNIQLHLINTFHNHYYFNNNDINQTNTITNNYNFEIKSDKKIKIKEKRKLMIIENMINNNIIESKSKKHFRKNDNFIYKKKSFRNKIRTGKNRSNILIGQHKTTMKSIR